MLTCPSAGARALRVRRSAHENRSVRPLGPRKDQRRRRGAALAGLVRGIPHLDVLITHKLHTGASMLSAAPVTPEEGSRANNERVEQHTHEGSVCQWLCHSIDTARVEDRGGNCGCWPHTPRAGFHRLPCAARAHEASAKPGQRSVPSGWRAKSRPEKRPCFQGKATSGGPYPGTGEGVSTVSSCASGQAGANSVVRSGSG